MAATGSTTIAFRTGQDRCGGDVVGPVGQETTAFGPKVLTLSAIEGRIPGDIEQNPVPIGRSATCGRWQFEIAPDSPAA
jgi:hypothetical protein